MREVRSVTEPVDENTASENTTNYKSQPAGNSKSSTPSIKNALNSLGTNTNSKISIKSDDGIPEMNHDADDLSTDNDSAKFTEVVFQTLWKSQTGTLKSEDPRMYNVLNSQQPVLKENYIIEVSFLNNTQVDEFRLNIKPTLLKKIRDSLGEYRIEFHEVVKGEDYQPNTKHYTDSDKLKHMIEKNPSLQKLRQEFNLDFE